MTRRTKLGCILLAAVLSVMLNSCSIPRMIGGVDTMLTPPRLTDAQNDIYDALTDYLSGDSIHLVYPQKGENLSAFILCDLDDDSSNEAVVFYQPDTSTTAAVSINMAVLALVEEKWQVVSESTLDGSAIEDVTLLTVEDWPMLAVGLSYAGENGSSLLDVFVLQGDQMELQASCSYQAKTLGDLTGNGSDDLLLIYTQEDSEGQTEVQAGLFCYQDGFQLESSCVVNPEMNRYQQLSVEQTEDGVQLYLDGYRGNQMITEVLRGQKQEDSMQLQNCTWSTEGTASYPQRASLVSMDMDGDGRIEVPGQTMLPGYSEEDSDILYLTRWYRHNGTRFLPGELAYVNSLLGYQFLFPKSWEGTVTAYRDSDRQEITFYQWQDEAVGEPIFSIRAVTTTDWRAGTLPSDYQLIARRGQIVFTARVWESENMITIEEIRERFLDLG